MRPYFPGKAGALTGALTLAAALAWSCTDRERPDLVPPAPAAGEAGGGTAASPSRPAGTPLAASAAPSSTAAESAPATPAPPSTPGAAPAVPPAAPSPAPSVPAPAPGQAATPAPAPSPGPAPAAPAPRSPLGPVPLRAVVAIEPTGPSALATGTEGVVDAATRFEVEIGAALPDAIVVLVDAQDAHVAGRSSRELGAAWTKLGLAPAEPLVPGSRYALRVEGAATREPHDPAGHAYEPASIDLLVAGQPPPPPPRKRRARR